MPVFSPTIRRSPETLCLPGTHTKWVRIEAGEIIQFKTFMTGELFNLLATQSVLRHSLDESGLDKAEFAKVVASTALEADRFAERLFSIRAESRGGSKVRDRQGAVVRNPDRR